jgi:hypothetical protein
MPALFLAPGTEASTVIAVRCLRCRHRGQLRETDLPAYGEKPGAPIARFIKRLVCRECGSQSIHAQRVPDAPDRG